MAHAVATVDDRGAVERASAVRQGTASVLGIVAVGGAMYAAVRLGGSSW